MNFNLKNITPVLNHLKSISPNMYKPMQNEIMIHCPFCDDSTRKKAANHGHLYLSVEHPVFCCFRCNASGTLLGFLIQTGFNDQETISYISQFIKISFTKDYYKIKDIRDSENKINQLKKHITEINLSFKKTHPNEFKIYLNYLKERIGFINFIDFLLFPNMFHNFITCNFNNYDGETVLLRYINNPKYRYQINKNSNNLYYFQKIDLFNKYNKITFCEGPFDIISLYLYNDYFKDNLFISINGKNYLNVIEGFLLRNMLIGSFQINIIFDNDYVKNSFRIIKGVQNMINIYNAKIHLEAHKPLNFVNDVAEFSAVERIIF